MNCVSLNSDVEVLTPAPQNVTAPRDGAFKDVIKVKVRSPGWDHTPLWPVSLQGEAIRTQTHTGGRPYDGHPYIQDTHLRRKHPFDTSVLDFLYPELEEN